MDNSDDTNQKSQPQIKFVPASDYKEIYIDGARVGITAWDMRIIFSLTRMTTVDSTNEDLVSVIMSPQHMKAMLKHLDASVGAFEAAFGPIPEIADGATEKALAAFGNQAAGSK